MNSIQNVVRCFYSYFLFFMYSEYATHTHTQQTNFIFQVAE